MRELTALDDARQAAIKALADLKETEGLPQLRLLLNDSEKCGFDKLESVADAAKEASTGRQSQRYNPRPLTSAGTLRPAFRGSTRVGRGSAPPISDRRRNRSSKRYAGAGAVMCQSDVATQDHWAPDIPSVTAGLIAYADRARG